MKNILKDTSADSYTWTALCVIMIVITGIYLVASLILDSLIGGYDNMITNGMVTVQNKDCFDFNILLFKAFPVMVILSMAIWAIAYTIRSKEGGGY